MKSFAALCILGALIVPSLARLVPRKGSLPTVAVKGNAFYAGNERFYIRGVAYQPGGDSDAADPLLDIKGLARDIKNFKALGINTIRVYTIDNSQNHDEGMKMLDDAGIYLALDANTPHYSLNRLNNNTLYKSYNDVYLQSVFATVDAFADYNNLLLLFSGNEVINNKENTNAATYVKAVTRDMKAYIKKRNYRQIPVGYSAADVANNIEQQALFFDCGPDTERADFFAFNDYSWCDPSSFTISGWDKKIERYKDYPVPMFLSEFGCIKNTRKWTEIQALYSNQTSAVYSGGLVYEYTTEPNGYGLVKIDDSGNITPNDDFTTLKAAYAAQKNPTGDGGAKTSGKASECPPADDEWEVTSSLLPTMPKGAQTFMNDGAGKGPGLEGSSQDSGTPSESTAKPGEGSGSDNSTDTAPKGAGASVEVPLTFMGFISAILAVGVLQY